MDSVQTVVEIVTASVAATGLGLTIFQEIRHYKEEGPQLRVVLNNATTWRRGDMTGEPVLSIDTFNYGKEPIAITGVGFITPDGTLEYFEGQSPDLHYVGLPKGVAPSEGLTIGFLPGGIPDYLRMKGWSGVVKLRAFCDSAADRRFKSKLVAIHIPAAKGASGREESGVGMYPRQ